MPRKPAIDRLRNYQDGIDPERIKARIEQRKGRMVGKQAEAISRPAQMEDEIKGILAKEATVSILDYVWYLDFSRQIFSLKETYPGGKPMEREAAPTALTWSARGLDLDVLNRILADYFSLPAAAEK